MIGVFGGAFDPVHCGHLRALVELRDALGLSEVRVVPCGSPPHRTAAVAPASARVAMLDAGLREMTACTVDERELRRAGPSYTVDTLTELHAELPGETLCLLLGHDAFLGLHRWHRWRELFALAHVVVARRPRTATMALDPTLAGEVEPRRVTEPRRLRDTGSGRVLFSETTELAISSTAVRAQAGAGQSLQWLVPAPVERLIATNSWYERNTDV